MGMLDTLKKVGGMFDNMAPGLAYLQSRRMGADPIQALAALQQMQSDKEYKTYLQEMRAQQSEQRKRQLEQEQQAENMRQSQLAVSGMLSGMDPQQRAQWVSDPANLAWLSQRSADPGISQAMVNTSIPQQTKLDNLGTVVESGVKYLVERDPVSGRTVKTEIGVPDQPRGEGAPASIQEWEAYQRMTPEEQQQYLNVKRGAPQASSQSEKFVLTALDNQRQAMEQTGRIRSLTTQLETLPDSEWASGVLGKMNELGKQVFGAEDNVTLLRTLANEVSMAKALQILPPGVASDRDVALAMSTTMPPTANKQALLSWLKGAQKIAEIRAQHANFQVQHMQNDPVGGLFTVGPAWQKYSENLYNETPSASAADVDLSTMTDEQLRKLAGE